MRRLKIPAIAAVRIKSKIRFRRPAFLRILKAVSLICLEMGHKSGQLPVHGAVQNFWLLRRSENTLRRWNRPSHLDWAGSERARNYVCLLTSSLVTVGRSTKSQAQNRNAHSPLDRVKKDKSFIHGGVAATPAYCSGNEVARAMEIHSGSFCPPWLRKAAPPGYLPLRKILPQIRRIDGTERHRV